MYLSDTAITVLERLRAEVFTDHNNPYIFPNPSTGRPYKCLHAAFGKSEKKPDVSDLIKEVEKTYSQLEDHCWSLLRTVPEIAIVHPVCKSVLTKP